jgi:hypothetical protein
MRWLWMMVLAGGLAAPVAGWAAAPDETVSFTGTVAWKTLEAGFYALDADDGAHYVPINLPAEFKVDGQRVQVSARVKNDMVGIQLYGRFIEIVDIAKLPPPITQTPQP